MSEFVTPQTLNIASSQAPFLDDRWRHASWAMVGAVADQNMVAYLREQTAGWSTATEPPTTAERTAEESVADRAVLGGYIAGRSLLGSADRVIRWPAECEVDLIYELFDQTAEMDIAELPLPVGEPSFLQELAAAAGWPENEHLLSLGAMAFDSALACALLEHDRFGF